MADTRGGQAINIERDIVENGESYDFFQAVKLLNRIAAASGKADGEGASLRIQPELNLDYPRADIVDVERDETSGRYSITTSFFGLYGVSSPLPGFYTEELLDDEWEELGGRKAFLDIIHSHVYPLLYQAWLKYKFAHNVVEFDGRSYLGIVYSLVGLADNERPQGRARGEMLRYAGLLGQRSRSLLGLKTLLQGCLEDLPVDIRPCVERKVAITRKQRCLLGRRNATLGADACIGKQVVDRGGKFEIEIGPLDAQAFAKLSDAREIVARVRAFVKIYLVQPLDYSISLLLQPGAVGQARLGQRSSALLGGNCWLADRDSEEPRRVVVIDAGA